MSGCSGACCAAFPLSHDRDLLWLRTHQVTDAAQILFMLLPISHVEARARLAAVDSPATVNTSAEYFTCRHWHRPTRRCLIYEDRPQMCRTYPNGSPANGCGPCEHGCPHTETPDEAVSLVELATAP